MLVKVMTYRETVYQELFPNQNGPNPRMAAVVVEARLIPDDRGAEYVLGRMFFDPQQFSEFGLPIDLEVEELDEREDD